MIKIDIPDGMEIIKSENGIRLKGTAQQIIDISEQIRPIKNLPPGGFALLDEYELVVSNQISRINKRISLPADAWNIMASKFIEVAIDFEQSPFDFSDCGYLYPKPAFDIGVELIGKPFED